MKTIVQHKYSNALFAFLYIAVALVMDSSAQIFPVNAEQVFNGTLLYGRELFISALFVLATLTYVRLSVNRKSKSANMFLIILSILVIVYPILIYPLLPQYIMNLLRSSAIHLALSIPKHHAYITIASEIVLLDMVMKGIYKSTDKPD